jgi:hypothetical protein
MVEQEQLVLQVRSVKLEQDRLVVQVRQEVRVELVRLAQLVELVRLVKPEILDQSAQLGQLVEPEQKV